MTLAEGNSKMTPKGSALNTAQYHQIVCDNFDNLLIGIHATKLIYD